jgi:hypothetical protein
MSADTTINSIKAKFTAMTKRGRFSIISRRVPESSAGTYRCQAGREVYRLACCTEGRLNGYCGCLISIAEGSRGRNKLTLGLYHRLSVSTPRGINNLTGEKVRLPAFFSSQG